MGEKKKIGDSISKVNKFMDTAKKADTKPEDIDKFDIAELDPEAFEAMKAKLGKISDIKVDQKSKQKSVHTSSQSTASGGTNGSSRNSKRATTKPKKQSKISKNNVVRDGDPVNVVTGSLLADAVDISLSDSVETFELRRSYESIYTNEPGMLGSKWLFNIESSVSVTDEEAIVMMMDLHLEKFELFGHQWRNSRNGDQSLTLISNADGYTLKSVKEKKTYTYNIEGKLISITDRNHNSILFIYDGPYLIRIELPSRQYLKFEYDHNKVKSITDTVGRKLFYEYDADYLTKVKCFHGGTYEYEYEANGFIVGLGNPTGVKFLKNQYDKDGRVLRQEMADGQVYTFEYNEADRETIFVTEGIGSRISYIHNKDDLITKTIYSDQTDTIIRYDALENIIYERDRCGAEIHRTYNKRCLLIEEILPSGLITGYEYDEYDNLVHARDNAGSDITYVYDLKGNCIEERKRLDTVRTAVSKYQYDAKGRKIKDIDANGNVTSYDYQDEFAAPTTITTPLNEHFYYTHDELGRDMSITGELGTVTFAYNLYGHRSMVIDGFGNTTKYFYNRSSKLIKQVNPNQYNENTGDGTGILFSYDKLNRRIRTTDALGAVKAVKLNTEGKVIKEISPNAYDMESDDGEGIVYEYDRSGYRIKAINPDGAAERFRYDANGNLIKRILPEYYNAATDDGLGYTYEYDSSKRLIQITNPEGIVSKRYIYDLQGNIIKEMDARGYASAETDKERVGTLYQYNLAGWLLEERSPVKEENGKRFYRVICYQYDNAGNRTQEKRYLEYQEETGLRGQVHILNFEYDGRNRLIKVSDSTGGAMEYRYNSHNQLLHEKFKINDEVSQLKNYTYDAAGRVSSTMESSDKNGTGKSFAITKFQYDKNGNIIRIITPKGNEIRREYDACDQLITEIHEEKNGDIQNRTSFAYDRAGNLVSITDNTNHSLYIKYDYMNREILRTDKAGGITYQEYDKNGRLQKRIRPNEYEQSGTNAHGYQYIYNAIGQLTSVLRPDGSLSEKNTYNDNGELIEQTDAYGAGMKFDYDMGGRRVHTQTQAGSSQEFRFDASGNIIGVLDGNKNQTIFRLDEWGKIIGIHKPDGSTEAYEYDHGGHIIRTVDGEGNQIRYQYNTANLLSEVTYQMGDREVFLYDEEGNLKEKQDRNGNIHQFGFNMYGNLTFRQDTASGLNERYEYYPDGKLKAAVSEGMRYDYSYYPGGLLKEKEASGRMLLGYQYDKNGNKVRQRDITGKETEYRYNSLDLLTEIYDNGKKQAEYEYLPNGMLTSIQVGEGLSTSYEYDLDLNLTKLKTVCGENELVLNQYGYDGNGNRIRNEQKQGTTIYAYDAVNRLVKAEYPAYTEELYYDRAGNRTRRAANGVEELYEYDARNRLTERRVKSEMGQQVHSYLYDNQGNLLSDDKAEYSYDSFHRLTQSAGFDGQIQINRYDAEGLRYETEENGELVKYLYNDREVVLEETKDDRIRYIRGYLLLSSDSEKAKTYYHYSADERNSITHVMDEDGELLNHYEYDAFGNQVVCEERLMNRFRYAGQQYDPVTEQYYLRARYYNPVIGRFLQEDVKHNDGLNLYAYCRNNPVSYYDPSGYSCEENNLAAGGTSPTTELSVSEENNGFRTFYSVQNVEHAKRLLAGGEPWPTQPKRAHLGQGLYAWGNKEDAINYKNLLEKHIDDEGVKLVIVEATISEKDLSAMNSFTLEGLNDDERTEWLGKYSSLYGEGLPHGYDYIKNKTERGEENYFSTGVFDKFKISIKED